MITAADTRTQAALPIPCVEQKPGGTLVAEVRHEFDASFLNDITGPNGELDHERLTRLFIFCILSGGGPGLRDDLVSLKYIPPTEDGKVETVVGSEA